jgi:hypothetical protein
MVEGNDLQQVETVVYELAEIVKTVAMQQVG